MLFRGSDTVLADASVSVADLQAAGVPLEWHEALAVVQSACKAILDGGDDIGPADLRPSDVFIASSGGVSVTATGAREGAAAVRSVADILRSILPEVGVPTPLRLVMSQTTSTPTGYASIQAFSQALEFFERPNRTELVKAVYTRYMEALANAKLKGQPPPASPIQVKKRLRLPPIPQVNQLYVRRAAVLIFALAAGGLAAYGVFLVMPRASTSVLETGNVAVSAATDAVDKVVDKILSAANRNPSAAEAPAPEPPVSAPRRSPAKPRGSRPPPVAPVAEPAMLFGLGVPSATEILPAPTLPAAELPSVDVDPVIYSERDADVIAPVAIYPRLPTSLPPNTSPSNVAVIEAVIDESGEVESVRVRRSPSTMSEAMIVTMTLSATKTWRFRPGIKSGVPVRYRQAIWVVTY